MRKILSLAVAVMISGGAAHAQDSTAEMQQAMQALGAMFGGAAQQGGEPVKVVHQRQLRERLPAEFSGMRRTNAEAGRQAAFGMNVSYAEATYESGRARIEAKISDIGGMGEFIKMAQFAWANAEMERESDRGFERTTKIDGFPAQESFEFNGQTGNVQIMVDGRLVVEISGSGVPMEKLHEMAKVLDLKKLAALQPE